MRRDLVWLLAIVIGLALGVLLAPPRPGPVSSEAAPSHQGPAPSEAAPSHQGPAPSEAASPRQAPPSSRATSPARATASPLAQHPPSPPPATHVVDDLESVRRFMLSGRWSTSRDSHSMAPSSHISFSRDGRYYLDHSPGAAAVMMPSPTVGTWQLVLVAGRAYVSFDGEHPGLVHIDTSGPRLYVRNQEWFHPRAPR